MLILQITKTNIDQSCFIFKKVASWEAEERTKFKITNFIYFVNRFKSNNNLSTKHSRTFVCLLLL